MYQRYHYRPLPYHISLPPPRSGSITSAMVHLIVLTLRKVYAFHPIVSAFLKISAFQLLHKRVLATSPSPFLPQHETEEKLLDPKDFRTSPLLQKKIKIWPSTSAWPQTLLYQTLTAFLLRHLHPHKYSCHFACCI